MIRGSNKSVGDGVVAEESGGDASGGGKSPLTASFDMVAPCN
jgi:hypothetical protein